MIFNSMMLMFISLINAEQDFDFVITFVEFVISSIYFILAISLRLYICFRRIKSIINRFSLMMSSLIKQSYRDLKFVSNNNNKKTFNIRSMIDLMTESTSNSFVIAYNLIARILLITRLHLVNDQ